MPLCVSPQEAMPVVLKRDSLDAMGPVVGEELLEEAAALAASAEQANDELRLPTAPPARSAAANREAGNSNPEASRGEVVEGLGESDFELSMTELRNAGLIEGGMAGWTVWSQYD